MSRSNYDDEYDGWAAICWRGAVASATKGKRGQQLFKEMVVALDAMPEKRLIASSLECPAGVCAMGAVGKARGMDMSQIDPEEPSAVAKAFGVAGALAQEIAYMNDEYCYHRHETPEERWTRMRKWAAEQITP